MGLAVIQACEIPTGTVLGNFGIRAVSTELLSLLSKFDRSIEINSLEPIQRRGITQKSSKTACTA